MSRRLRQGAPLAQNRARAMRVGGHPQQEELFLCPIRQIEGSPRPAKGIMAVAASILTTAYYLLRHQVPYRDPGALYFARIDKERTAQRLARRIKELGYEVDIRTAA